MSTTINPNSATPATGSLSAVNPAETSGNSGRGGGGGGVWGGNNNNGLASSAALYLYTFLATLILLLAVSAAIVLRSFILRRRQRLLVEEAIRNGTWVPGNPPAGAGRRPRVDLSQKPGLWEVYLGEKDATYSEKGGGGVYESEVREWEGIKPLYAAYVPPDPALAPSVPLRKSVSAGTEVTQEVGQTGTGTTRMGRLFDFGWLFGRRRRPDVEHQEQQTEMAMQPTAAPVQATTPGEGVAGAGQSVRVAVLIAMPRPPSSHKKEGSSSTSSSGSAPHPLSPPAVVASGSGSSEEEEEGEPLPVLEVGVAEVVVVSPEGPLPTIGNNNKLDNLRDSASMTAEV